MKIFLAGVLLTVASSAFCDDGEAPVGVIPVDTGETPEPEGSPTVLEDIVVTAAKRAQNARDVPGSLAAISGAELESSGASEMRDFLRAIPGVELTELQPDLFRVSIRGIQADVSAVTPQTEGIFLDEVPLNDPFITQVRPDVPLFDLERVEVLKGPQGTLFGGSGLGGAIRYQTVDAQPRIWEAKAYSQLQSVTGGSPNRLYGAALNVPIGSAAAVRVTGVQRDIGGVIDDLHGPEPDTDKTSNSSGRALLRWNATNELSVGLKIHEQRTVAEDLPWADTTDGRLERSRRLRKSPSKTRFQVASLDIEYERPWGRLISVTGSLHKTSDLLNAYGEQAMGTEASGQPVTYPTTADISGGTQELRWVSPEGGDWRWLAGVYGQRYSSVSLQRVFVENASAPPSASLLDFAADITAHEYAVFGEAAWDFLPRWRATLGARGYRVETQGTVMSSGPLILATGSTENRNDANVRGQGVNPKLALSYDAAASLRTYLSASRGFRFGGIQIVGPSPASPNVPQTYSSDSLWNYELGFRTDWLDDSLTVDGAVFLLKWKDPQVQTTTGGAVPLNAIDNADSARSQGAELAVRYLTPISGLQLGASAAYTDARITSPYTSPSGTTVPAGSRLPGYSSLQAMGRLDYRRSFGAAEGRVVLSYAYQGRGTSDILQSQDIYGYGSTDARIGVSTSAMPMHPEISLGAVNLFDRRAVVCAIVNAPGNEFTVYNRPRTLDVRLDLRF